MFIHPIKNINYTFSTESLLTTFSEHKYKVVGVALAALALLVIVLVTFVRRKNNAIKQVEQPSQKPGQTINNPVEPPLSQLQDNNQSKPTESQLSNPLPLDATPSSSQVSQTISSQSENTIDEKVEQLKLRKEEFTKCQGKALRIGERIAEINGEIKTKESEIEKIKQRIQKCTDTPSQGVQEIDVWELKFDPEEKLRGASGIKIKASQYIGQKGSLHEFDKKYKLLNEDDLKNLDLSEYEEGVLVVKGSQIQKFECIETKEQTNKYKFTTLWEGKGVLPYIKVVHVIIPNINYIKAEKSKCEAAIIGLEKELEQLTLQKEKYVAEVKATQQELDSLKEELKKLGDNQ